jgi:hypothetical protein
MKTGMRVGCFMVVAALATLVTGARVTGAGNWYVDIGPEFGRIASEEKTRLDGFEGAGIVLGGGYRFNPTVSLEVCFSGPAGADAMDGVYSLGTKFDLLDLRTAGWTPWAALYVSGHMLEWTDPGINATNLGFSAALGADFLISQKGSIQPAIRFHSFDAHLKGPGGTDLGSHKTTTVELTVAYVYHFWDGRP